MRLLDEHGRKFYITVSGIRYVTALTVGAFLLAVFEPQISSLAASLAPVTVGAIAGMIATFITGNSAVTFAYARADSRTSQESVQISERREQVLGYEPTP